MTIARHREEHVLTDEEHEEMSRVGDQFWLEFSELCQRYVDAAPPHLRAHYKMFLGEKTSIYGIKGSR